MLWIISGASSVGKSTFIDSEKFKKFTGFTAEQSNIIFGYNLDEKERLIYQDSKPSLFHYNIARSMHTHFNSKSDLEYSYLITDPVWDKVSNMPIKKKAIVLVASKTELINRVKNRQEIEPIFENDTKNYNSELWENIYSNADISRLYSTWCESLEKQGIEYVILDSTTPNYQIINSKEALKDFSY